jgi:antitoxin YefM
MSTSDHHTHAPDATRSPPATLDRVETIPITEAAAGFAELADRVTRERTHVAISRGGRADVPLMSVAEYESTQETLDILNDEATLADVRQSREDFAADDRRRPSWPGPDAGAVTADVAESRCPARLAPV